MTEYAIDDATGARTAAGEPIPLTGVAVEASLSGPFLAVTMRQRWSNPGRSPVEALWRFPVPEGATVRGLAIERAGRRFRAEVEERDEAFDRYDRALEDGRRAVLLDAETEGILALRLGNLDAGDSVLVEVSWVAVVEESGGSLRVRVPTAIAPRYFPVERVERDDPPLAERLALPWADRVPYGLSVELALADAAGIAELTSPSHPLALSLGVEPLIARLGGDFAALDRDVVLDVRLAADRPPRVWFETDARGSWLAADVRLPEPGVRAARAVAFLLDVSGSMEGESLAAAGRALKAALGALSPGDRFGLFAFANEVTAMAAEPLAATDAEVLRARAFIDGLEAGGGTELRSALESVWKAGTWTEVLVLTDGDVGDAAEIGALAAARLAASGTRLSLLGIGSAPAGDALAAISRAGGGATATVHPGDRIETRALALAKGMLSGRVEALELRVTGAEGVKDPEGASCENAAPIHATLGSRCRFLARLPAGSSLPGSLELRGKAAGEDLRLELAVHAAGAVAGGTGALACLWARDRVADLLDRAARADSGTARRRLEKAAVALSREAGILSTVASMVIVDASGAKVPAGARRVDVPVLIPAGYGGGGTEFLAAAGIVNACLAPPSPRRSMPAAKAASLIVQGIAESASMRKLMKKDSLVRESEAEESERGASSESGPGFYALLALQLPGGGFGPLDELLALLGLAARKAEVLAGPGPERARLAALALAWLELRFAAEAADWESLVEGSRSLLDSAKAGGADVARWAKQLVA